MTISGDPVRRWAFWPVGMRAQESFPKEEVLLDYILKEIAFEKDMKGRNGSGDGRSHKGGDGSGALHHQSFHWKNGLCGCQKLYAYGEQK